MTGLRLQIVAGLLVVTVLLNGLLGLVLLRLEETAMSGSMGDQIETIQDAAGGSLGSLLAGGASQGQMDEMARHWLETGSIDGLWTFDGSGREAAAWKRDGWGGVSVDPVLPTAARTDGVAARGPGSENARFLQVPAGRGLGCVVVGTDVGRLLGPVRNLRGFVILYIALHALAILALSYAIITLSVVRPIERLRGIAVRLGEGRFDVDPEVVGGSREARDLSRALAQTARKLEAQRTSLESHIRDLEAAQEEIRARGEAMVRSEKLASVGRLAAGVAHEIGNPLAVILGFLEILGGEGVPEKERAEYISRMQGEAERMNRIVKDLLSYARLGTAAPAAMDVRDPLDRAIAVLAPQKGVRKVEIALDVEPGLPRVEATTDRLSQVFVNLILNAAEAMVGEGKLRISAASDPEASQVVVRFEDDGPGVDESILPLVFEPFVTTKPESQGTGLGLAVCHNIVTGFGGTVTAGNRAAGGAVFEVRLPAVAAGAGEGQGDA